MPRRFAILVAIGLSLASLTPAAAARDPKAVARAKLMEGAQLLQQGDYEEALSRFQEAYESVPSPKIFYNYGLALRGLGRNAEAIAAFDRFLAEAPDAAADKRTDATRRRAELLKKVAILEISSEETGAEIVIDGTSYGQIPRTRPIYLDGGPHLLSVRKGTAQHVQRLTAERGQKQTIVVSLLASTLTPPPAQATVGSLPPTIPSPARPEPAGTGPEPDRPTPSNGLRVAAWSTGAASVVFLAGGAIEMVMASQKLDTFGKTLAPGGNGRSCGTDQMNYGGGECQTLHDDWSRSRTLGLVGLIGGGLLAATSATLFVLSSGASGDHRVACAPTFSGIGASCGGRF
jgi:hypothetical protein